MRRRIDMAEVEAATKIRAKYLRALESEEWELLPGPTFVKTFLRTYAEYLELDARLLVEEYKQRFERPAGDGHHAVQPAHGSGARGAWRRGSGPALVVVLGIVSCSSRSTCSASRAGTTTSASRRRRSRRRRRRSRRPPRKPEKEQARRTADARAASSPPAGLRLHGGLARAGRSSTRRRSRPGQTDPHVPRPSLQGHLRHGGGAHPPEREELSRGDEQGPGRLRRCARARRPQRITSGLAGCT